MGKNEPSKQGRRLKIVINSLNVGGISNSDIVSKIKDRVNIQIDNSKLHQFCNTYKFISDEVIDAFHECFNVNPLYIKGRSESMYDNMMIECELFNKLVKAFSSEKRYHLTPDNQEIYEDFLVLEIKRDFYNFLIKVANLQALKKQDKEKYVKEVKKILEEYNKLKEDETTQISYGKYALLPEDYLLEIADDKEESHFELNPQRYKIHNIPRNDINNFKG